MRINKLLHCFLVALLLQSVCWRESLAQSSTVGLDMGGIRVYQKYGDSLKFALKDGKTVNVDDRAGSYWPPVHIDEQGFIYVGDKVLNSRTGLLIQDRNNPDAVIVGPRVEVVAKPSTQSLTVLGKDGSCEIPLAVLQKGLTGTATRSVLYGRVHFAESANMLAVLSSVFTDEGEKLAYRVSIIDPRSCRVLSGVDLGNPDLLVELGWSPVGGFWIVGAQEPTLLRSEDGISWVTVKIPPQFSELMSAYIAEKGNIWLAALDGNEPDAVDSPALIHSADDGKTWQTLTWNSPLLNRVPMYWLEGQMRAHGREVK